MNSVDELRTGPVTAAPTVRAKRSAPSGFEPGRSYVAGELTGITLQLDSEPSPDETDLRAKILAATNIDLPDTKHVEIAELRWWGQPGAENVYVKLAISDRSANGRTVDYAELLKIIKANRKQKTPAKALASNRTRVVVISDAQVGKVASGGGHPEFLARIDDKLTQLIARFKAEPCEDLVIIDPGDLIENDKNVNSQARTNDLTLPEQLPAARAALTNIVSTLSAMHMSTRVVTVPSNHGQYRDSLGKGGGAGKPSDDWGIDVHRAVAETFAFCERNDVTWMIPETWRESLSINVRGEILGVVHGHQFNQGQAGKWWAGQSHGDQPTAAATILIHGHYHNASIGQSGAIAGRPRWVIAADAMDGGSDWFQNLSGEVSEPSITTFTIDDDGWDNYRRVVSAHGVNQ